MDAFEHLKTLPYPRLTTLVNQTGPLNADHRYDPDPWGSLVRVVIGQQVSTQSAQAIWSRVTTAANGPLAEFLAQPQPGIGLSQAKARTLSELAQAYLSGQLALPALAQTSHEERLKALLPYWGVGPWTVEMWSLFHCRDPDIWSAGDLVLKRGAEHFSEGQATALIEAARPYRSYLAFYCWHAANANLI